MHSMFVSVYSTYIHVAVTESFVFHVDFVVAIYTIDIYGLLAIADGIYSKYNVKYRQYSAHSVIAQTHNTYTKCQVRLPCIFVCIFNMSARRLENVKTKPKLRPNAENNRIANGQFSLFLSFSRVVCLHS